MESYKELVVSEGEKLSTSQQLKELGNNIYREGKYEEALGYFTKAIELYPFDAVYFCNRSMCYASLLNWELSWADAKQAVRLDNTYVKAYYRVIKAQIELGMLQEARTSLQIAHRMCKSLGKDLEKLEKQLVEQTGIPIRPVIDNFTLVESLGDGNFSKIYRALYNPSGKEFAIKEIDKANAQRMKRRHPNINNEILMEKQALYKLSHPNIVQLYCTFQDSQALYYLTEYVEGGELWNAMSIKDTYTVKGEGLMKSLIGLPWSFARFYTGELINAIEYMHSKGIAHRDLKPENIMLSGEGHIKIIDFGTAKDILDPALNGQEFVGTAEYMSPEVIRSHVSGIETDLWALGTIVYQFYMGFSAFSAPSPYLSFLKVKRGFVRWPSEHLIPPEARELISLLLVKDRRQRLINALGDPLPLLPEPQTQAPENVPEISSEGGISNQQEEGCVENPAGTVANNSKKQKKEKDKGPTSVKGLPKLDYARINYDRLRNSSLFVSPNIPEEDRIYYHPENFKNISDMRAKRIPSLHDLCVPAVSRACGVVAHEIAKNGGTRPESVRWIKEFDLQKIHESDRCRIAHILSRQQKLHPPGIFRLFHRSLVDARCMRASLSSREFVGLTRDLHGEWGSDFFFAVLGDPQFGMTSANLEPDGKITGGMDWSVEQERLLKAISAINRLRPKFVVVMGDLTNAGPHQTSYIAQAEALRRCMARISETIPVLFLPGNHDLGDNQFSEPFIGEYTSRFGADYYGFWFGGVRGLVLNSMLMIRPDLAPEAAKGQDEWFDEELEQAKLCGQSVLIFSHHPWLINNKDEQDSMWTIPLSTRRKWLRRMHNKRVQICFAGHTHRNYVNFAFAKHNSKANQMEIDGDSVSKDDTTDTPRTDRTDQESKSVSPNSSGKEEKSPYVFVDSSVVSEESTEKTEDGDEETSSHSSRSSINSLDDMDVRPPDDKEDLNEEDQDYEGPEIVACNSCTYSLEDGVLPGIRLVRVHERSIDHNYYELDSIPKKIEL